jgi:hypothetical protein
MASGNDALEYCYYFETIQVAETGNQRGLGKTGGDGAQHCKRPQTEAFGSSQVAAQNQLQTLWGADRHGLCRPGD